MQGLPPYFWRQAPHTAISPFKANSTVDTGRFRRDLKDHDAEPQPPRAIRTTLDAQALALHGDKAR